MTEKWLSGVVLYYLLLSPVVAQSAKYNPHSMRDAVIGKRDLRGATGEPGERLRIEVTVGMRDVGPRDPENARIPFQRASASLGSCR